MLRIGLTGGIGAGKSTVSSTFAECGGVIVDGDVISREVVQPGTEGLAALVDHFGHDILLPDGALNRPALTPDGWIEACGYLGSSPRKCSAKANLSAASSMILVVGLPAP